MVLDELGNALSALLLPKSCYQGSNFLSRRKCEVRAHVLTRDTIVRFPLRTTNDFAFLQLHIATLAPLLEIRQGQAFVRSLGAIFHASLSWSPLAFLQFWSGTLRPTDGCGANMGPLMYQ